MKCFLFLLILISQTWAWAQASLPHGYVQDVQVEKSQRFQEIFLFAEPPPAKKPLQDAIFNTQLSREFRHRYRDTFGAVDTDSLNYQHSDYDRLDLYKGNNSQLEGQTKKRRSFGEYMVKRLFEWHVDNYIKSEPAMRPVYEMKEKLSKMEVKVTKETKLEARYSLAGNTMDLILENPYCDSKLILQMDPGAFGPSSVEETTLVIGRPLTTTLRTESRTTDRDKRNWQYLIKSHTSNLSSSYGLSSAYGESDFSGESRIALGMGYSF